MMNNFEEMNETQREIIKRVISMLKEGRPFDEIRITNDQMGKQDHLYVTRTQKVVLSAFTLKK